MSNTVGDVLPFAPSSVSIVTPNLYALPEIDALFNDLPSQDVPIEVLIDPVLLDRMEIGEAIPVRIDGWRDQVYEAPMNEIMHDGSKWTLDGALAGIKVLDTPHDGRPDILLKANQKVCLECRLICFIKYPSDCFS